MYLDAFPHGAYILQEKYRHYTHYTNNCNFIHSKKEKYRLLWECTLVSPNPVWVFSGGSDDKESACNAGDPVSIPWSGRSLGEANGNPFQYSCLENPMNRRAWWATVHGVLCPWGHTELDMTEQLTLSHSLNGLVVFTTFFNLSLKFELRSWWSEPQSAPGLVFVHCVEHLHLRLQRI